MVLTRIFLVVAKIVLLLKACSANLPPIFTQDMNNLALSESTQIGSIVYTLEGYDPEGEQVTFGLIGSDNFEVNPKTGEVKVIKLLDRETQDTLSFLVSIKDRVNNITDSENDNLVTVPITVIVLDENDNAPEFQNVPYEANVPEDAKPGTTIFDKILITDRDTVGENLDVVCIAHEESPDACFKFSVKILDSSQDKLRAVVVLDDKLDYNERMIYQIQLLGMDGLHNTTASLEIHVKDVQNTPPIFQGSLVAAISEDSPIGTLVMTVQARDGDRGQPRNIVYDLMENPMDYFLLDSKTGELRTAKPLDKESLNDETGLIKISIRAREVIDGDHPSDDSSTSTITSASITIKDVNDTPPTFNQREYFVKLSENTPPGTPLPIEMSIHDPDIGNNAVFAVRLDDVSEVFDIEPKLVVGSSQLNIRVANGTLDYENPNQRKFIVLVIAEETLTSQRLSSTATVTVQVEDANDNRPKFEHESYTTSISEAANPGQFITSITAKDLDSGNYGEHGIRYGLSGAGSENFNVDPMTGTITVASCSSNAKEDGFLKRERRSSVSLFDLFADETLEEENIVTPAEVYEIKTTLNGHTNQGYHTYAVAVSEPEHSTTEAIVPSHVTEAPTTESNKELQHKNDVTTYCLDYETQPVYFLSYKATDNEGKGHASVVSLKIQLTDANDSPPICESPLYKASIDEGATTFEPPLIIKARDADVMSELRYSIVGANIVKQYFEIDERTGQLTMVKNKLIDINHVNKSVISFGVHVTDGSFSTVCNVNITIRDVNNHAPAFSEKEYIAMIKENQAIGTLIAKLSATDEDTGINAEIRYRIQQGAFDDFIIDDRNGEVTIAKKLDYDRRSSYQIEVIASDFGSPSLSSSALLMVKLEDVNDKAPYFVPTTQRSEISEDAEEGTLVTKLVALDPDIESNELLEFSAIEPITAVDKDGKEVNETVEFKDVFRISRDGKVYVNKPLKRDEYAVIRMTVKVSDTTAPDEQEGLGLLIITIIDINEFPPIFAPPWTQKSPKYSFQVIEEQQIDTILTTLQATDADSNIAEYKLSDNDYFAINPSTGLIAAKSRIDYEKVTVIKMNATVTDTGIPQLASVAEIIVDVININDNDPIFNATEYNFKVKENASPGTIIGQIQAVDEDAGQFGEIEYSLVGDYAFYFSIEPKTGEISVRNNTVLDREMYTDVSITGVATDLAPITTRRSTTIPINIQILDENDNGPSFNQHNYFANVAENVALNPPAAILQVAATDKDDGNAGIVKYFIKSGNRDETFILNPDSGILYPRKSLLGKREKFNLEIEARDDLGQGPHTDTAEVVIEVHSINQHRPVFIMPTLTNATIEIPEHLANEGYLVMTVKANDTDEGDNGKLAYHLQFNNENVQETNEFRIDENTGEVRIKKKLDRKSQEKFELILVARDHGTPAPYETLRFLTVLLVDIKEHNPEFPDASNPYKFHVVENSYRDQKIGKIQAVIENRNHLPEVYYYILLGNEEGAFYLDKITGDIFTNKSLDREHKDEYALYILASKKSDLHISEEEISMYARSVEKLERDSTIAKVHISVLDVNDNPPKFDSEKYYAGISSKASLNELVTVVNATDLDYGQNSTIELLISASYLYKYGATKTTGSIVPSPFSVTKDGRIVTSSYMAEYNQDRFILEVIAKEVQSPERIAKANVYVWIFDPEQLVRVILSRPPTEVHQEREEIISELSNATQKRIIVDEIRYHVDSVGRIRMDWCDLYFHAVDPKTNTIVPVVELLTLVDSQYDFLKDYYAGFAIENVVPAYTTNIVEEFDIALAAIIALLIVLFVGTVSFIVLCCCLKHWVITIPSETRRKDALIKKQIIEDLNTTENPLWIEQKLKLYEEQELTMQVFSEPENTQGSIIDSNGILDRRDSYETTNTVDNTYATIQPRNISQIVDSSGYASLRNPVSPAQMYEFRGSTFQVQQRDPSDYVTELI